ncbi:MAG: ABC-2 family transporter protein [Thermomicrobiales bacterium]|nr:ABC-2 family transporter protein [Thermomicrobiales bacterium]
MNMSLFLHYARLRMKERMEYRAAFILGVFAQIVGYGATYFVLWLTLQKFETIGGWNWPEIALLYSLNVLTYAIGAAYTYTPMTELEQLVQKGTFDPVLIRPNNPFMTLTAQMFNVGYLAHILLSGGILVWSLSRLDADWTFGKAAFLMISVLSGACMHAALLTLIGSASLVIVRAEVLFRFNYSLQEFISYPVSIFGPAIQILLTTIVPLAFINFLPLALILNKDTGIIPREIAWLTPIVGPVLMWLAYRTFQVCTNRYQGAGG